MNILENTKDGTKVRKLKMQTIEEIANTIKYQYGFTFLHFNDYSWSNTCPYNSPMWRRINEEIKKAPLEECLTSPSEYVREYKKWLLKDK